LQLEILDASVEEISLDKSASNLDDTTNPTRSLTRPGDLAIRASKLSSDSPLTSPTNDVAINGNTKATTHARKLSDGKKRKLGQGSSITSPTSDVDSLKTDITDYTHARSTNDDKNSPRTSPTREITSPTTSAPPSARAQILSDTSESISTNHVTQEIVASPRDTSTVRARLLSDKTDSKSRSRKVSDQKPAKVLERCVSEADLTTTRRQRSKSTISNSSSLKSPRSSVRYYTRFQCSTNSQIFFINDNRSTAIRSTAACFEIFAKKINVTQSKFLLKILFMIKSFQMKTKNVFA